MSQLQSSITRRQFGRTAALGCLATPLACTASEGSNGPMPVVTLSSLNTGDIVDFTYPDPHAAFLVKLGQPAERGVGPAQDIVAFHRACPHQGCPMQTINVEKAQIGPCNCHFSLFDLRRRGTQIVGRATQNLVQIRLVTRGDQVLATGVEGVPFGEAFTAEEVM